MKRFLPFIAAAILAGCSATHAVAPVTSAPVVVVEETPSPTVIAHGDWSVTLLPGFIVDEMPVQDGEVTRILAARSKFNVGRGPVLIGLSTAPFDGPPEVFAVLAARIVSEGAVEEGGQVLGVKEVPVGDKPASLTVTATKIGLGITVLSTAVNGTGYMLTCGGDILQDNGPKTAKACLTILRSFTLKDQVQVVAPVPTPKVAKPKKK